MNEARILVLGIGNILWADEGFGVRVVQRLMTEYSFPERVALVDGGTQGLGLMPYLQEAENLIIIDAVDFQQEPGTLILLRGDEVPAYFGLKKMSLHQISFQEVLAVCELMGQAPKQVFLVGMQPQILEDYGGSLSSVVKSKLGNAQAAVLDILQELEVSPEKLSNTHSIDIPAIDISEYERLRPSNDEAYRFGDSRFL